MDVRQVISKKRRRLRDGNAPRVLDLFAGCGGLTLGFHRAGFEIVAAIEGDSHAMRSHATNFIGEANPQFELHAQARDITQVDPDDLSGIFKLRGKSENAVDIIVGGPPCQAFARVGRAKLREVDEHPEAFLRDPRSNLYLRYLHYVRELMPLALLMENVPDVMNFGGHNIAAEVCDVLERLGYSCGYTLLNAAFYGVPQMRERMFLVAYRKELGLSVEFPQPTHWMKLPPGYAGSRQVALKGVTEAATARQLLFDSVEIDECFFVDSPTATEDLQPAVTTQDALGDLPPILARELHASGELKRGARRFTELARYRTQDKPTSFGKEMRSWPGFENNVGIYDHVIRALPRDYRIFAEMQPGDQYPEARALAMQLCETERRRRRIAKETPEHEELVATMVPPYDPDKFPNKWRKLESFLPSRTLLAHMSKDTYSHIHYDDAQARTISVREAARLQSFPDGFRFSGTMNPAFRQIGNAVPPLVAFAIARQLKRQLQAWRSE